MVPMVLDCDDDDDVYKGITSLKKWLLEQTDAKNTNKALCFFCETMLKKAFCILTRT